MNGSTDFPASNLSLQAAWCLSPGVADIASGWIECIALLVREGSLIGSCRNSGQPMGYQ